MADISDLVKKMAEFKAEATKQERNGPASKDPSNIIIYVSKGCVRRLVTDRQTDVCGIEEVDAMAPETEEKKAG